jgi:cytochrome c oxidase subunit 4
MAESHDDHHGDFHIVPVWVLVTTGSALLLLTIVTVLAAKVDFSEWDLKELNIWIALAIAVFKASLVCLFFMHLRYDRPFNAFVFVASVAFVALFIGFAMTDTFAYRGDIDEYVSTELEGGEPPKVQQKIDGLLP